MRIDETRDFFQGFEIVHDLFAHSGSLHFHHDSTAIAHPGTMHLSQRSRRERLRIEFRERLRYTNAEFRRDNCVNLFKRKRFDFVLQAGQRIEVRLGQKIAARR